MPKENKIEAFLSGTHNRYLPDDIPRDAAQDELNWITQNGQIELSRGRIIRGGEGGPEVVQRQHIAYKIDGTVIEFRLLTNKIQYLNGSTWTDVVIRDSLGATTTTTRGGDYTFSNVSNIYVNYILVSGPKGRYIIMNYNPALALDYTLSGGTILGYQMVDKARGFMWGVEKDPTGFYGSRIENQVANPSYVDSTYILGLGDGVQTVFTGTIPGIPTFITPATFVRVRVTPSATNLASDNLNGLIVGPTVNGTVDYETGAISVTFTTAPAAATNIQVIYRTYDFANRGVFDFTSTTPTRIAGEGFILRQDEGGDPIKNILLGLDGAYYSFKAYSVFKVDISADDLTLANNIFRKDLGLFSQNGVISTGDGIVFMDSSNPTEPRLRILERNPLGDNTLVRELMPQFKFEKFYYDKCFMIAWNKFIVIGCKSVSSLAYNDRLLLVDFLAKTVDITAFDTNCFAKNAGELYAGSPYSATTYSMFTGFAVNDLPLNNFWTSKNEKYGTEYLKKYRRQRIQGEISRNQNLEVYLASDEGSDQLIGTIRGDGSYVSYTPSGTAGYSMIGSTTVGGNPNDLSIFTYYAELKIKTNKFRKRYLKFKAIGIGFISVNFLNDFDIYVFENRMPVLNRTKTNVNLAGTITNMPNPQF